MSTPIEAQLEADRRQIYYALAKIEEQHAEIERLRTAMERALVIFEDRERYVMQGPGGALEGARILRDALDTEKDEKDISKTANSRRQQMGTRGALGFQVNGKIKATYNHSDSYPEYLGEAMLKWVKGRGIKDLHHIALDMKMIDISTEPTEEDKEKWRPFTDLGVSNQSDTDWYCLSRGAQGDIGAYVKAGAMPGGGEDFMQDSLYCEWAWIINVDGGTFDVYRGFQKTPPEDGFFTGDRRTRCGYHPVNRVASFSLSDLPEDLSSLNEDE